MPNPPDQPQPGPRRVLVAGLSGSGKTTLAARLADVLDIPHVELDSLHHGPGWVARPTFLEPPLRTIFTDREHVVRYMVTTRHKYDALVPDALASHVELAGVRLRSTAEVEGWVAALGS